jgi:hypothetical protein
VSSNDSALVDGVEKLPAGTYQFHCTLHPWMHGAIEVAAGGGGPPEPPPVPDPGDAPNPLDLVPHASPAPLTGGDWPLYGHDLANTRDGGTHGPTVDQVPSLRPVWSVQATDGDFTGTPVELDGTVVAVPAAARSSRSTPRRARCAGRATSPAPPTRRSTAPP